MNLYVRSEHDNNRRIRPPKIRAEVIELPQSHWRELDALRVTRNIEIVGMRDVIVHWYVGILPGVVWDVIRNELSSLRSQLASL